MTGQANTPPKPKATGSGTELGMIEEAAASMRRMQANEEFDASGVRTIWHRGRSRTEMLSWENKQERIIRQELQMFGRVVEFRAGHPLRTGTLPNNDFDSAGGHPESALVNFDRVIDQKTLEYASHLLRHFKGRDFYAQHLLAEVNTAIAGFGFDDNRTKAVMLRFTRSGGRLQTLKFAKGGLAERRWLRWLLIGLGMIAAMAAGAGTVFWLRRR
jgi:hypothetical protein